MQLHHQLTETAVTAIRDRLRAVNVGNRATADLLARGRIVIRRTPGLYDRRTDTTVRPRRGAERVVVPEHESHVCIHPPAVPDILGRYDLTRFMRVGHAFGERDSVLVVFRGVGRGLDLLDPACVLAVRYFNTHDDVRTYMEGGGVVGHFNFHSLVTRLGVFENMRVHRNRHAHVMTVLLLLIKLAIRTHRLVIRETGDNAVRRLVVELEEVGMDVHLRHLEVGEVIIVPLTGQQKVHAVVHVSADDKRQGFLGVRLDRGHVLVDDVDQAVLVDDRLGVAVRPGKFDRGVDEVQVVLLAAGAFRAQAPTALFTGFRRGAAFHARVGTATAGFRLGDDRVIPQVMERLKPRSTAMVTRERHALAKMRRHVRPRQLAVYRVKLHRETLARNRRGEFRHRVGRFTLRQGLVAVPAVIPDRTVVSQNLPLLIVGVARLTLRRQHLLDPVLDVDDRNFLVPLALAFANNLETLTVPVDFLAEEFSRVHAFGDVPLAVGKLDQRTHDVGAAKRIVAVLQRVVHAPVTPHARDIVMRHVAMEQKVTRQLLTKTGTALGLQVNRFGGANNFNVNAVRRRAHYRVLDRTVVRRRQQVVDARLTLRRTRPADRAAMRMVRMEHFATAVDQAELRRVAHVRPRNRGRGIAEGVGAVRQGFVFVMEHLLLNRQVVDTERLRAVVHRAGGRTVRVRLRVALRDHLAVAVERTERFVTDFVIEQRELTEVLRVVVNDHGHPAVFQRAAGPRIEVLRTTRLNDKRTDQAEGGRVASAMALDQVAAFLLFDIDEPLKVLRLAGGDDRARGRRRVGLAGVADDHRRTVDLKTDRLVFHRIGHLEAHAVALVAADDHRLDSITLQTGRNRARIEFVFTRGGVLFFLGADLVDVLGQHVHVTREVVAPLVQRDLDVDRRDVVFLGGNTGGTMAALTHLGGRFSRRTQQVTVLNLMRRPRIVETAACRSRSGVFLQLALQAVHQVFEGLVQLLLIAGLPFHHFFVIHLVFQLLQPYRPVRGLPAMALMGIPPCNS